MHALQRYTLFASHKRRANVRVAGENEWLKWYNDYKTKIKLRFAPFG